MSLMNTVATDHRKHIVHSPTSCSCFLLPACNLLSLYQFTMEKSLCTVSATDLYTSISSCLTHCSVSTFPPSNRTCLSCPGTFRRPIDRRPRRGISSLCWLRRRRRSRPRSASPACPPGWSSSDHLQRVWWLGVQNTIRLIPYSTGVSVARVSEPLHCGFFTFCLCGPLNSLPMVDHSGTHGHGGLQADGGPMSMSKKLFLPAFAFYLNSIPSQLPLEPRVTMVSWSRLLTHPYFEGLGSLDRSAYTGCPTCPRG